jgi:hypothetical protein
MLRHPGESEIYFLQAAYPIGIIGAAVGLSLAGAAIRNALPSRRQTFGIWVAGLVIVGAVTAYFVAHAQPRADPLTRWKMVNPSDPSGAQLSLRRTVQEWITPTAAFAAVLALLGLCVWAVLRYWLGSRSTRTPALFVSLLCLLLGTGLYAATLHFGGTGGQPPPIDRVAAGMVLPATSDQLAAGRLVDEEAGSNDVVGTNMICDNVLPPRAQQTSQCDAHNFLASAFTQRRTLVGGWVYADRNQVAAWNSTVSYRYIPFWNQPLLVEERSAYTAPTATLLDSLYRNYHLRWLFLDPRIAPIDVPALNRLARLRLRTPSAALWQLRPPG